ncbi:MAG TPA: ABC transporter substrate-binding protein, partial [Acidimicrobiales bacterium]|nr:ABC transporter substrate-binding protein [Acidimicrobiales bacterium]
MRRILTKRIGSLAAAFIACAGSLVAASGSLSTSASAASSSGTDITYALPPAVVPNYIFPIMGAEYYSNVNVYNFDPEMFRPLYWFGQGTSPTLNKTLSLAEPPVYTNGGKTVTITLKKYKWSDGTAVTSKDVLFYMQMLKAEQAIWPAYVP